MTGLLPLFDRIHEAGIRLWVEGDRLCFRGPRGAMTAEIRAELNKVKQEAITLLLEHKIPSIEPGPVREDYELSPGQKGLWLLAQIKAGAPAYNMFFPLELRGCLDRSALEVAFREVISRHEILRTTFVTRDGQPSQQVRHDINFQLLFVDWSEHKAASRLEDFARAEARRAFDLERGPLLRVCLIRIEEHLHRLLVTMHHIISDGWSLSVLGREIGQIYSSHHLGTLLPLPPLPIQYRDYTVWLNELLRGPAAALHRKYWLEKLYGELPLLQLPTDFPRRKHEAPRGRELAFPLGSALTRDLTALAQAENASLFMLLTACLNLVLFRHSGQDDIIVGTPSAGRTETILHDQIGYYLNTLALRASIERTMSFRSFLGQIRQTVRQAFDHQVYPFEWLVEELQCPHHLGRTPIFDVMIILQNHEPVKFDLSGIEIRALPAESISSKFDLLFDFAQSGGELRLLLEYCAEIFTEERVLGLQRDLAQIFKEVVTRPDATIEQMMVALSSTEELSEQAGFLTSVQEVSDDF